MRIRDFLALVKEDLPQYLPSELREFRWRIAFSFLQVYYWRPSIHYEFWPQRRTGRIELGLHFEGEREDNLRWLAALAERMPEVQATLGPQMEIEEWTQAWTRLHYTVDYVSLGEALVPQYARQFARLISRLQPMLEEIREQLAFSQA